MLVYSNNTGWIPVPLGNTANAPATDVTVTIPSVGAYLANGTTLPVTARTDCPVTTVTGTGFATTTTNSFYPVADSSATDTATRLAALNDGTHIVAASPSAFSELTTNSKSGTGPIAFTCTQHRQQRLHRPPTSRHTAVTFSSTASTIGAVHRGHPP